MLKKKSLSSFGYIIESMGISIRDIASTLHVDASLVSKWKTGARTLSTKSAYFDDIMNFLMDSDNIKLKVALWGLYPHVNIDNDDELHNLLYNALSNKESINNKSTSIFDTNNSTSINSILFDNNSGRREAVSKLLDYAEQLNNIGEITFIDNEQYRWLTEDTSYSEDFTNRIISLVKKGFHVNFVVYYPSNNNRLNKLFNKCNPLIFHNNISWYYQVFYDTNIINYSIFILNKAISVMGMSVNNISTSTLVFTDPVLVLNHELIAQKIIEKCNSIFFNFDIHELRNLIPSATQFRKNGTFYSFLPAPTFLCADEELITDILTCNDVSPELTNTCIKITNEIKHYLSPISEINLSDCNSSFMILQLEELLGRAHKKETTSLSLSIICNQEIKVTSKQYVIELKKIVANLKSYKNFNVILVSHKDYIYLPNVNCFCKQNIWMIQMTKHGFRSSDEFCLVNASSNLFEQYYRKVPSERKRKESVCQFFEELIENVEKDYQN